ncbi:MAG TPA: nuclear transport factor 2 family protein [Myxococcales bacterium]|nr:nuclear transport factor 2 family protein [Myxococcales bacterium]
MPDAGVPSPDEIAETYFSRVRARDLSVVDLFHQDAELVGLGARKKGHAAIRDFYGGVIERAGPTPTLVGSLLVDGERVAAEIVIELAGGSTVHAVDVFLVQQGLIRSLTYFIASE